MKVVDHEPSAWFLLQDDDDYYLDVNCGRSAVGFSVTIQLTEVERKLYASGGRAYIDNLASQVSDKSDPSDSRNIRDPAVQKRIYDAVVG